MFAIFEPSSPFVNLVECIEALCYSHAEGALQYWTAFTDQFGPDYTQGTELCDSQWIQELIPRVMEALLERLVDLG